MPENESLFIDSKRASRWRPIADRLDLGEKAIEQFPEIERQFYTALKNTWDGWQRRGIDPRQLFHSALHEPSNFSELRKRATNDEFVLLLRDVVAVNLQTGDMNQLVADFLDAAWSEVSRQLQLNRRGECSPELNALVQFMLRRIGRSLGDDLARFPRRPNRRNAPVDLDSQLGESLL
ncbi:MAG: hypothetical protein JSS02_10850 [Planctomycetes bacterium]|nr:hypothetical protein [Planctomycetota bacterium]